MTPDNDAEDKVTFAQIRRELEALRHRFRLALIGYGILAIFVIASLAVSYFQEREIDKNQKHLEAAGKTLAVLLSDAQLRLCMSANGLREQLHVDHQIDCNKARQSATKIYQEFNNGGQ